MDVVATVFVVAVAALQREAESRGRIERQNREIATHGCMGAGSRSRTSYTCWHQDCCPCTTLDVRARQIRSLLSFLMYLRFNWSTCQMSGPHYHLRAVTSMKADISRPESS